MKKLFRKVSVFLAILTVLGTLTACGGSSKINDTLDEFEYAARNMDIQAMLDCIDPIVADPVRDIFTLYNLIAHEKAEEAFENMINEIFGIDFDVSDFLTDISFEDRVIKTAGSRATVKCRIICEIKGEPFKRDTIVTMRRKNKKWYIAGVEIDYSDD